MLDYHQLEMDLRNEATVVAAAGQNWNATEVSQRLMAIADQMAAIRRQHAGGVDASMGKRSGLHLNEP